MHEQPEHTPTPGVDQSELTDQLSAGDWADEIIRQEGVNRSSDKRHMFDANWSDDQGNRYRLVKKYMRQDAQTETHYSLAVNTDAGDEGRGTKPALRYRYRGNSGKTELCNADWEPTHTSLHTELEQNMIALLRTAPDVKPNPKNSRATINAAFFALMNANMPEHKTKPNKAIEPEETYQFPRRKRPLLERVGKFVLRARAWINDEPY